MKVGAQYLGDNKCDFIVWAPFLKSVSVNINSSGARSIPLEKMDKGYWHVCATEIPPGTQYFYSLSKSKQLPDPASFYQPEGVHGSSEVVDHKSFIWDDSGWGGVALNDMVLYELHIGAFTSEGTFDAAIPRLDDLAAIGINAIEIMPLAQFPGERNWGYDGAYPYAVQNSYGGPVGLKRLVDAAHQKGISVILDVVYNHLGPEGNYLSEFAPYFTDNYKTPWGNAINFDDRYCYGVRNFFIGNMLSWFDNYHIDGLRLDAVHSIFDRGAKHILEEMSDHAARFSDRVGRKHYLIAESDLNDARMIRAKDKGGYGIDAQWSDDYHHQIHALLTQENTGYYRDFQDICQMEKALVEGFIYAGQYSEFRKRNHGGQALDIATSQFIVYSQNHDQVGNRARGERLANLIPFEGLKLSAGGILLSGYTPMLFMGQEYAADTPFLYFVSHSDERLIKSVREGRKAEFHEIDWDKEPLELLDPQSEDNFKTSKLNWQQRNEGKHNVMLQFYKALINMRKNLPALMGANRYSINVSIDKGKKIVFWRRWHKRNEVFCIMNFNKEEESFEVLLSAGKWKKFFDSADTQWMGAGSLLPEFVENKQKISMHGLSFALYEKEVLK